MSDKVRKLRTLYKNAPTVVVFNSKVLLKCAIPWVEFIFIQLPINQRFHPSVSTILMRYLTEVKQEIANLSSLAEMLQFELPGPATQQSGSGEASWLQNCLLKRKKRSPSTFWARNCNNYLLQDRQTNIRVLVLVVNPTSFGVPDAFTQGYQGKTGLCYDARMNPGTPGKGNLLTIQLYYH